MIMMENKQILLEDLSDELIEELKLYNAIIAGGAITSIFMKTKIKDYDIYFRTQEDMLGFLRGDYARTRYHFSSNKSITLIDWKVRAVIQVVCIKPFPTLSSLWSSFDFTVCMGCFDFKTNQFILHERFLVDIASRTLIFNEKTQFPIISLKRVKKYEEKGFSISNANLYKIAFAIHAKRVDNVIEMSQQIGGMYGDVSLDIFIEEDDKCFDPFEIIKKIEESERSPTPIVDLCANGILSHDIVISHRCGREIFFYKEDDRYNFYDHFGNICILTRGTFAEVAINYLNATEVSKELIDIFPITFLKYVKCIDGRYFSFFDNSFEYKEGEWEHNVYAAFPSELKHSAYYFEKDKAVAFCHIDKFSDINPSNYSTNDITNSSNIKFDRLYVEKIISEDDFEVNKRWDL